MKDADGFYKIVYSFGEAENLKKQGATTFYSTTTTEGKEMCWLVIYETNNKLKMEKNK